jgi:hypothetical protein
MPSASNINSLNCQTDLKVHFERQRVFPALSNLIVERDDGLFDLGLGENAPGPFPTRHFAEAVANGHTGDRTRIRFAKRRAEPKSAREN